MAMFENLKQDIVLYVTYVLYIKGITFILTNKVVTQHTPLHTLNTQSITPIILFKKLKNIIISLGRKFKDARVFNFITIS